MKTIISETAEVIYDYPLIVSFKKKDLSCLLVKAWLIQAKRKLRYDLWKLLRI